MITESDNTATNMLIRLVGRQKHQRDDAGAGDAPHAPWRLHPLRGRHPSRCARARSRWSNCSTAWRTTADRRVVVARDDREYSAGQRHNSLLPAPLPRGIEIAHKTGTLHDTLNDVGIVYYDPEPYMIAVMTTHLPDLDIGRSFIRGVSSWPTTSSRASPPGASPTASRRSIRRTPRPCSTARRPTPPPSTPPPRPRTNGRRCPTRKCGSRRRSRTRPPPAPISKPAPEFRRVRLGRRTPGSPSRGRPVPCRGSRGRRTRSAAG